MTQLYIGNLPDNCSEDFLQQRFDKHGQIKEILLKGKFAFLEYDDSKSADLAIQHEKELIDSSNNMILDVELANRQVKPLKGPVTLHILNIPGSLNWEKLKRMLCSVGNVEKAELVDDGEDTQWKRGIVTYELKEEAQSALEKFHESNFEGTRLQIICPEPGPNSPLKQNKPRSRKGSTVEQGRRITEESNFPVRLVVPSTMIGAIIGKEGKTIRRITDTTGARVDIHRKDNAHSLKKAITVFGNADTCNQAISMILKIMQDERATLSKPAVSSFKCAVLELLAHNDLLLKIFGPQYSGLIELMDRTGTQIMITQTDELGKKSTPDRHVIIEGSPEKCCAAQREISEMYNSAFNQDMMCIMQMSQSAASPQQGSPGFVNKQINQNRGGPVESFPPQKMRYAVENQSKMMVSPPQAPSQLSPNQANAIMRLLSDIRGGHQSEKLIDHQREQLVLAGQLISSDYLTKSPQSTCNNYQKFSTPKHPVYPESPQTSQQGYSPFRFNKPAERSPMKQNLYPIDETFNMMSMLDDILGSRDQFDASQDSGLQASPQHLFHAKRNPYWPAEESARGYSLQNFMQHSLNSSGNSSGNMQHSLNSTGNMQHSLNSSGNMQHSLNSTGNMQHSLNSTGNMQHSLNTSGNMQHSLNSTGNSSGHSSSSHSPEEMSFYNSSYVGGNSSLEEDFLSNSLLRTPWSSQDDKLAEASSLRRELHSDMHSEKAGYYPSYPAPSQTPAGPAPPQTPSGPGGYTGTLDGVPSVKWTNMIPLVIGQKIESIKPTLEQITGTNISLTQHPSNDKIAIIKAVGTSEGTQMLQNNVQLACKQLVHGM